MPIIRPSTAYLAKRMQQLFGKRQQPKKEKTKRKTSRSQFKKVVKK
ncbi:MAG: hypothetical protein QXM75_03740 [Candidatus Diapherotrites archaeon]